METFTQVKNSVVDAAKEAKDKMVDLGQGAKDLVLGMADKLKGQVEGRAEGPLDALQVLKEDHELVNGLFAQLNASENLGPTREGLFGQLKYELETHATTEEKLFYPAVEQAADAHELVRQALADHAKVKQGLAELAAMSLQTSDWLARLNLLRLEVERHVRMEEDEIFPAARETLSTAQLQELGRCITVEKDASERQPTPPAKTAHPAGRSTGKGSKKSAPRASHH